MGLAWLARKRGVKVIGLTSPAHVALLESTGLYDEVVAYDAVSGLEAAGPAGYVDFAGRGAVTRDVHAALGQALVVSLGVGVTHWDALAAPRPQVPGIAPVFFFAPDRIRQRAQDWGMAELEARFQAALKAFVAGNPWLSLKRHAGAEALKALYADVVAGKVRPDEGHIVNPR